MTETKRAVRGERISRRRLLAATATAAAVPPLVPGTVLGRDGAVAASERTTVGFIGTGQRGGHALEGVLPLMDSQVVALCDVRRPRLETAQERVESYYAAQKGRGSYQGCATHHEFRELLAREDIDAVFVCPPDHWHGIVMKAALEAGKDVYGEKPLTRTIAEGVVVRETVRRYGRVFQTGTQQRSDSRFRHACELARNGYLGRIHTVKVGAPGGRTYPVVPPSPVLPGFDYDRWTGPAPFVPFDTSRCEWLAMYMISHYCAGFICNWGVHYLDNAIWGCPALAMQPFTLSGKGVFPSEGMTDTCIVWDLEFRYADGLKMKFSDDGKPNQHGVRFEGSEGWVYVNRSVLDAEPKSLLKVRLKPDDLHLHRSPQRNEPWASHAADFLQCVRTRQEPASPVEQGHLASTLGNVADICVRLGRPVRWDPAKERFLDDDDANRMMSRPMRAPWRM